MTTEIWVAIGLVGQALYGARFLAQWIASERQGRSVVPTHFWFLSLAAGLILLGYAIHRRDPVFILGEVVAVLIYARNLWFIYHPGMRRSDTERD